jgi:hypothetical protein
MRAAELPGPENNRAAAPQTAHPLSAKPIYDGFISYKHDSDKLVAVGVQSVLQTLGKPWWRLRAVWLFLDDTTLASTHELWPTIERALSLSRHLILIASPEAARSPWVDKEVRYWLTHRDLSSLSIALTAGELSWDAAAGDFVWTDQTPLPPSLKGRFKNEPLWIDLRAYRGAKDAPGKQDREFSARVASIAAAILGRAKEDLLSEERRQHRRNLAWAWSAAGSLAVLAGIAGWMKWEADVNAQLATEQRDAALRTESRFLADQARRTMEAGDATAAAQIALAALPDADRKRPLVGAAQAALYYALTQPIEKAIVEDSRPHLDSDALARRAPAARARTGRRVWSLLDAERGAVLPPHLGDVDAAFIADGRKVITHQSQPKPTEPDPDEPKKPRLPRPVASIPGPDGAEGLVRVFHPDSGALLQTLGVFDTLEVSKRGDRFFTHTKDGKLTYWDAVTLKPIKAFKIEESDAHPIFWRGDKLVRFFPGKTNREDSSDNSDRDTLNLDLATGKVLTDKEVDASKGLSRRGFGAEGETP